MRYDCHRDVEQVPPTLDERQTALDFLVRLDFERSLLAACLELSSCEDGVMSYMLWSLGCPSERRGTTR